MASTFSLDLARIDGALYSAVPITFVVTKLCTPVHLSVCLATQGHDTTSCSQVDSVTIYCSPRNPSGPTIFAQAVRRANICATLVFIFANKLLTVEGEWWSSVTSLLALRMVWLRIYSAMHSKQAYRSSICWKSL